MQVKPCNGRIIRTSRRDGQNSLHSDARGGSIFSPLDSLNNDVMHENGNPCNPRTEDIEQWITVSMQPPVTKATKSAPKPKSKPSNDNSIVTPAETSKPKAPSAPTFIFASPAYQESNLHTTLGPTHLAVNLSFPTNEREKPHEVAGLLPLKPTVASRISKSHFPPKPPDRAKPSKSLQLNPKAKFKVSKLKTKDSLGIPSEHLSHALTEA